MGRPIAFATLIVVAVFVPLFAMSGIEGRMYKPLAAAVIAAVGGRAAAGADAVPVVAAAGAAAAPARAPEDVRLIRWLKGVYAPLLDVCMRARAAGCGWRSLGITVPALLLALRVGNDFMPQLDEGAFLVQTYLPAEASLEEVDRLNHRVEDVLREFPEVEDVVRRTGRAERTEDPMPHTLSDVLVVLKGEIGRARSTELEDDHARTRLETDAGASRAVHARRSACASTRGSAARRPTSRCGSSAPTSTSSRALAEQAAPDRRDG